MIALVAGCVLVGIASTCLAALLRLRGVVAFTLAVAVLSFAEVVAVSHALSAFDAYERGWFLVTLVLVAFAAAGAAAIVRPPWPSLRRAAVVRDLIRDPVLAVLGAVVLAEVGYLLALALFTPPNEYDVLTYHLTRAVLWIQQNSIGPIPGVTDTRINEFPPDAEILQGATMLLSGSIRFVGLVQLASLVATVLAIYGTACRIGFQRRQAAFGALLFPTLTVVALQAPTALNDLVVAALVVITAFFALGRSRGEVALACVALALLVGTKTTGLLALPVLFVVCLLAYRGARLVAVLGAGLLSAAIGAAWYAVNVSAGEGVFGPSGDSIRSSYGVAAIGARGTRYLVDAIELPAGGRDVYLYAVAAGVIVVGGLVLRSRTPIVVAAALMTAVPLAVPQLERVMHAVYWHGWTLVGYPEATLLDTTRGYVSASTLHSWYGPVGLALSLASLVIVTRAAFRRRLPWAAVVLAVAPLALVLESAVATGYNTFNGRLVMGAVALAAATWGVVRTSPAAATATTAVAATTVLLALVNNAEKPAGIGLLQGTDRPSIWELPREWAQSPQPELALVIGYLDDHAVPGQPIAVTRDHIVYPFAYVGWPSIDHLLLYADTLPEATARGADWAMLADSAPCAHGWRRAFHSPPWAVWHREPDALCTPG